MNPGLIRRPDWKEMRRFRALELKNEGCIHEEIAETLGMAKADVLQKSLGTQKYRPLFQFRRQY
jgi:hypothetical protein